MYTKCSKIFFFFLLFSFFSNQLQAAQIKAIVFDFGGVIAKSDHEEIANFIASTLNISPQEAAMALVDLKKQSATCRDELSFWTHFAQSKGKKLPSDWMVRLSDAKFNAIKTIPGMIDLVKKLQVMGFKTALLSNVRESQAQLKSKLGYYQLFEPALFSFEIGVSKPDPKAYQILLEKLKLPPSEILFIDNKLPNIETAKSLGIDAIQFENTDQLIKELKQRGIGLSSPYEKTP